MKDIRNTVQKKLILEAVSNLKNHATADEVYEYIVKNHPSISKGTVYRNLKNLSESKEIKKVEVSDSADRYDHQTHNHYHVKCRLCGKVEDVDMDYVDDLNKKIKNLNGFNIDEHDIVFKGVCNNCKYK